MRLEPSTSPPRGNGALRQQATLAIAGIAFATSAFAAYHATRPALFPLGLPRAFAYPAEAGTPAPTVDEPLTAAPEVDDDAPMPVHAATCADPMIAPLVRPTTEADAAALRTLVAEWRHDPTAQGPGIAHRRGVLYVQSEEDRGDDPPYPRSAAAEASRVCGSATAWLHAEVQRNLRYLDLACDGNVCCYGASEYSPRGYLVFHHGPGDDAPWTLDAWVEAYVAALGPDNVDASTRFVTRAVARLAKTTCRGEPDRVD